MRTSGLRCWHIGLPGQLGPDDGVVAFTASEAERAAPHASTVISFHEAMAAPTPGALRVEIHVPPYRGKSLIPVLGWLAATRLGEDEAEVSWYLGKRQGPDSVRKLLEGLGWNLDKKRVGRAICLHGTPPASPVLPEPHGFSASLGAREAALAADYGIFSPGRIDEGTALLLGVALRHRPVDTVADIGIGYGPLAIGLVLNGVARSAVGTEVDCVALWLAEQNAKDHNVAIDLTCSPDPSAARPTSLTVCNIPTHISGGETARFMAGLAERAARGTLLAVVHASLEKRYTRHMISAGLRVDRHPGPAHVVLEARKSRG
ncbi:MAG: methyltransferase [Streptosporangiaceae bacterium]